ncbi:MAG TPA: hypothetical protein DGG95_00370 [Cytophagales bacterium]|jgi:hypothetical protein|nr:hypothetical protein [Cytophagales bacterium]
MTRQEIRQQIPMGYCKVIAQRVGVTQKSVSHFMRGKTNSHRIEMAALELIVELKKEKKNLTDKISLS